MPDIKEVAGGFVQSINDALSLQNPTIQQLVSLKPDDKDGIGKRMVGLLRGADAISETLQAAAQVSLGVIAIASTGIPGDIRCETEETGGGLERRFTFYRGDFRVGTLIITQSGPESGKVGGGLQVLIDEAAIVWPTEPKFSSN